MLATAITDKGLANAKGMGVIDMKPANDNYKGKCKTNSNKLNNIKGINGKCFDNTLSVEQNLANLSKRYNEIFNKGNKPNQVRKNKRGAN